LSITGKIDNVAEMSQNQNHIVISKSDCLKDVDMYDSLCYSL